MDSVSIEDQNRGQKVLKGHKIRSDLSSEHEKPGRVGRRLDNAQFGIYRPVTPECAGKLVTVLKKIEADVQLYLNDRPSQPAKFRALKSHGVTYLEQRDVRKALKHHDIDLPEIQKVIHCVDDRNYYSESEIEVPIGGFDWFGKNDRRLAGTIDAGPVFNGDSDISQNQSGLFAEESEAIGDILRQVGATALAKCSRTPGHISLINYTSPCHETVQREHREAINGIVYERFSAEDFMSMTLGQLVVGSNYSERLQLAA